MIPPIDAGSPMGVWRVVLVVDPVTSESLSPQAAVTSATASKHVRRYLTVVTIRARIGLSRAESPER